MTKNRFIKKHPFITFVLIAFLIGFGLTIPMLLLNATYLALIAASSASLSGLVTAYLYGGKKELLTMLKGLLHWPKKLSSYVISIGIPVLLMFLSLAIYSFLGNPLPLPNVKQFVSLIPTFILLTIQAGLGEELGWRGFAIPKLLKTYDPISASLLVGIFWAIWHLPLYLFSGFPQHDLSVEIGFPLVFMMYSTWVISASILHSYVYLKSGKSVIAPILFHGTINTLSWLFNFRDVCPYLAFTAVWVIAAVFIIIKDTRLGLLPERQTSDSISV